MNAILKIKDAPKKWLIPRLATLALVAVGGPVILLSLALGSGPDDGSNTSQAALRNADQVTELSIDGRLHFPRRMAMTFEADAAVAITTAKDAVADLGTEISISRSFDAEASEDLASLRAAEALAVADLDKARDDLAELEPGSDPRDLQKLVAATDLSQAKLDNALQTQLDLETDLEVLTQRQLLAAWEVAQAKSDVKQEKLDQLGVGLDPLERSRLQAAVDLASADLGKTTKDPKKLSQAPTH